MATSRRFYHCRWGPGRWPGPLTAAIIAGALPLQTWAVEQPRPIPSIYGPTPPSVDRLASPDEIEVAPLGPFPVREGSDYAPRGLHVGGFVASPSLRIEEKFDDDIFANDTDESDFVTEIMPGISVQSTWSRHGIGMQAFGKIRRYATHQTEDAEEAGVSLTGRLDVTDVDYLSGFASYSREAQERSDPDDEGQREVSLFDRYVAQTRYGHQFTRFAVRVDARLQRLDYVDAFDDDRDRNEFRIGPRFSYEISPSLAAFVEMSYLDRQYDAAVDDNGLDRDSQTVEALAGLTFDLGPVMTGEIAAGAFHTEFDDPNFEAATEPAVEGSLTWSVTELTTVTGRLAREATTTTSLGSSGKVVSHASLRINHELLRNVLVGAQIDYRNEDFQSDNRVDNRIDVQIGGSYLINRNAAVSLGYQYRNRMSNEDTAEFDENIIRLGVDLHM
jgi:hypothetical protein